MIIASSIHHQEKIKNRMKNMRFIYRFLTLLSFCFLLSCKTIPMSTESNPTLLVGEVIFTGSNYVSNNGIPFNGTDTRGIEIYLINTETYEEISFPADNNGLFQINLPEGRYVVTILNKINTLPGGAWANVYVNPNDRLIDIKKGKVNNIGTINWTFTNRRHNVEQIDNSIAVRNSFANTFPKSNWNEQEWEYIPFSSGRYIPSTETITYYVKSEDGQDSVRSTIPINFPDEMKVQMEQGIRERMLEMRNMRTLGDTTYYVKSENGLDSTLLTLPKGMPENIRRNAEEHARSRIRENRITME
jgi:hypothetical protein